MRTHLALSLAACGIPALATTPASAQFIGFDEFTDQLRAGRIYVSDGRSHLLDFTVDDTAMGVSGSIDTAGRFIQALVAPP